MSRRGNSDLRSSAQREAELLNRGNTGRGSDAGAGVPVAQPIDLTVDDQDIANLTGREAANTASTTQGQPKGRAQSTGKTSIESTMRSTQNDGSGYDGGTQLTLDQTPDVQGQKETEETASLAPAVSAPQALAPAVSAPQAPAPAAEVTAPAQSPAAAMANPEPVDSTEVQQLLSDYKSKWVDEPEAEAEVETEVDTFDPNSEGTSATVPAKRGGRRKAGNATDRIGPLPEIVSSAEEDKLILSDVAIRPALSIMRSSMNDSAGRQMPGTAGAAKITASESVRPEEVSIEDMLFVRMWRTEPQSHLRNIVNEYAPEADQTKMLGNDLYAAEVLTGIFNNNDLAAMVQKTVNDEATTQARIVRLHQGAGTRVHPMIAKQFTADHDGDEFNFSFEPEAIALAKNAMSFLKGTGGDLRIDPDFFNTFPIVGTDKIVDSTIEELLDGFIWTELQFKDLKKALTTMHELGERESGLSLLVETVVAIGNNPGQAVGASRTTAELLLRVYDFNRDVLEIRVVMTGKSSYRGPVISDQDSAPFTLPLNPDGSPGGLFTPESESGNLANSIDLLDSLNAPEATTPEGNAYFRMFGLLKGARKSKSVAQANNMDHNWTFVDRFVIRVSGMIDFEHAVESVSKRIQKYIIEKVGYPDISSDEAFMAWIEQFIKYFNIIAVKVNSANFAVRLDGSLMPVKGLRLEPITDDLTDIKRLAMARSQFVKIFGNFRMKHLFGKHCPPGSENYKLSEYVRKNKETQDFRGSADTEYNSVITFIGRVADQRTTASKRIYDRFNNALDSQMFSLGGVHAMTRIGRLYEYLDENIEMMNSGKSEEVLPTVLDREAEDLVASAMLLGKEAFIYAGLHNPAAYRKSAIGIRFREAKSKDDLFALVIELVVRYRFSPVMKALAKYDEAVQKGDVEGQIHYDIQYKAALNEIESSSDTWGTIVRHYRMAHEFGENMMGRSRDIFGFTKPETRFLSNFYGAEPGQTPLAIMVDGVAYPSVENAYQAAKTEDLEQRKYFENCSAKSAKYQGTQVTLREGWDADLKYKVMGNLLRQKFALGTNFAVRLMETGNGYLEETNDWGDDDWGVYINRGGANNLGHALMGIRSELRAEAEIESKGILDYVFFSGRGGMEIQELLGRLVEDDPLGRDSKESWEVIADLFALPQGQYSATPWISNFGRNAYLDDLGSSIAKMDAYGESNWHFFQKEVQTARTLHESSGNLKKHLASARKDYRSKFTLEPWMVADLILIAGNKTSASTEKGEQEHPALYGYSVAAQHDNGRVFTHMNFGGTLALGKMYIEDFWNSPYELTMALSDPTYSRMLYDESGRDLAEPITMMALLGTNRPTEKHLWDFLEANPRAAMSLRDVGVNNNVESGGHPALIATAGLAESISRSTKNSLRGEPASNMKAMRHLFDKPGFHALVAATVKWTGNRTYQLRDPLTKNVFRVTAMLRGLYGPDRPPTADHVRKAINKIFDENFSEAELKEIAGIYKKGKAQDKNTPEHERVTSTDQYGIGQLRDRMATLAYSYAMILYKAGVPAASGEMNAKALGKLFPVAVRGTRMAFNDTEGTATGAKTEQDTSANGADASEYTPVIMLSTIAPEPCDAVDPTGIDAIKFSKDWRKYSGRQAKMSDGTWLHVNASNVEEILIDASSSEQGMVLIEDPGACTSATCACIRHSTADQSTNYGEHQTPALVRLCTIVRTLSTEKLNLKAKKRAFDAKDSIKKNSFYSPLFQTNSKKIIEKVQRKYISELNKTGDKALAMTAARRVLALHMQKVFHSMEYENEVTLDDYMNIAQILIREIPGQGDIPIIKVLTIHQLNRMVAVELRAELTANENPSMDEMKAAALRALTNTDNLTATVSVASAMSGFRALRQGSVKPRIANPDESNYDRNLELVNKLDSESEFKNQPDSVLDAKEQQLLDDFGGLFPEWRSYLGHRPASWFMSGEVFPDVYGFYNDQGHSLKDDYIPDSLSRSTYRLIGYFGAGSLNSAQSGIGGRNAYLIDSESTKAVSAIVHAYNHGITVFIDGDLPQSVWKQVEEEVGIDLYASRKAMQGRKKKTRGKQIGYMIPMFNIRLNGHNTEMDEGAVDAGSFIQHPRTLRVTLEVVHNEFGLGDSSAARTERTNDIAFGKEGVYTMSANHAFANLLENNEREDYEATAKPVKQGQGDADTEIRLCIFGSRDYKDYPTFKALIEATNYYRSGLIGEVIISDEPGTSAMARKWAVENDIPYSMVTANWESAQSYDNQEIAELLSGSNKGDNAGLVRIGRMTAISNASIGFWDDNGADTEAMAHAKTMNYKLGDAHKDDKGGRLNPQDYIVVSIRTGDFEKNGRPVGNLKDLLPQDVKIKGIPVAEVANQQQLEAEIFAPFNGDGNFGAIHFDLGVPNAESRGRDETRLMEGMERFIQRANDGELTEGGWLKSAEPDEIVGLLRVETDKGTPWYHALRIFDAGNNSGAPRTMNIKKISFNESTGDAMIYWVSEGDMTGGTVKIMEDSNPSQKSVAGSDVVPNTELMDGTPIDYFVLWASNATRRLEWRRAQKLLSLTYKARTAPYGYNLAEAGGLQGEPELREMVLSGKSDVGVWISRLTNNKKPIVFFDPKTNKDAEEMNRLLNYMVSRCVRYKVDPTILLASYHLVPKPDQIDAENIEYDKVENFHWFNYQLVFKNEDWFLSDYMKLMNKMNPDLCPYGTSDTNDQVTLFDRNLQVERTVRDKSGAEIGRERVDMFIGFHFQTKDYYANSGSGTDTATYNSAALVKLAAGGGELTTQQLKELLGFGRIFSGNPAAIPSGFNLDLESEE